jgi:hypothetical protein
MAETNQKQEDEVLRRMLATKPTPHKTASKTASPKSGTPKRA